LSAARPAGDADRRARRPGPVYRFFGGKGGAGKTTCAAGAAVQAAERGRRVLVVSTDPAHSLGDALATRLTARPVRVATRRGRLAAVELDADRALARWLAARRAALRAIAERGTYLDDEDIDRLFRLSLPGVDELVGLIELTRLGAAGPYDEVVVDTAPTGHALRLLAMPETVRRIAGVLDHMLAKHRFMATRLGGAYRPDATDALIEEMDAEGRRLAGLLRDPRRAAFAWVLLPETLAVEETRDAVTALTGFGLSVRRLIVNRVRPRPVGRCAFCAARRRAEARAVAAARRAFPAVPLALVAEREREPRGVPPLRAIGAEAHRPARLPPPTGGGDRRPVAAAPRGPGPAAPAWWLDVVAPPATRLLLFAGKGGVGKTTCAAAAALALAARNPERRILLLSTDPAHSLADVLATPLGNEPRRLPGAAGLQVRELDAHGEFGRRRERYRAAVDELFDAVRRGSTFDAAFDRAVVRDLIDLSPPGIDELFAVVSVTEALLAPAPAAYDLVVVDTAPTGHTLRLLALPAAALEWIRALLAILLKYRRVVALGALAEDLVAISRELRQLDALLRSASASRVVAVTRPAALPRLETARFLAELRRRGIPVPVVLVNAVTPAGVPRCARCARAVCFEAREIAAVGRDCRRLAARPGRVLRAPAVAPPPRGPAALERWGATWESA
jgi:arsenite-transporting ATPase